MKQNKPQKRKMDKKFMLVTALAIVVLLAAGILFSKRDVIDNHELPVDGDSNIHELVINEIMTNNGGTFVSENNQITDYLELYNGTGRDINLKGYGLSDRPDSIKWAFGDVTIKSGGYLTVALTGKLEAGLNAAFRLTSKGGETVILTNSASKVIDAVDVVALSKNQTMMRDANGAWFVANYGTPGYPNTAAGLDQYFASLKSNEGSDIAINEFLCKNKANFVNEFGDNAGFIEVINISDHNVDLSEYTLGDSHSVPFRYTFDSIILKPKEVFALYIGKENDARTNYTGFNFTNTNGVIVLSRNGKIVQDIPYENLSSGVAIVRASDGSYYQSGVISFGYPNTADGVKQFQNKYMSTPKELLINEVMTSNDTYLPQNGNKYYDWLELYNNSGSTIRLSDYYISKTDNDLKSFQLPDVELKAGEYYIIMCSGNTGLSNNTYQHASFKIGSQESLYLSKDSKIIDCINVSNVPYGYSYGRGSESGFFYMAKPSPGAKNEEGKRVVTMTPSFSLKAGVYDNVDKVTVEIQGDGKIYYTTDGSTPTASSKVYTTPMELTATTVLRARAIENGAISGKTATASYIINENHTVPVVSLAIEPSEFTYINQHAGTRDVQRQCNAELFEEDGTFNVPCSIACFGGNARYYSKKSYALRFASRWGAKSLDYQVFKNRDTASYESIVLRSGSSDWSKAYMRDILGTSVVDDYTDVDVQAYKISVVYVNGKYWGLYNIREKINSDYIVNHYNVSADDLDLLQINGRISSGTRTAYNAVRSYARNNSPTSADYFAEMSKRVNMVNIIDYWIAEMYVANNDILNCRYFSSPDINEGRWQYIYYDLDFAWYNLNMNYYTRYLANPSGIGIGYNYENDIIRNLLKNKEFRALFLERLAYNMQNTWSKATLNARLEEIYETLKPEMQRNLTRWKLSASNYEKSVDELRNWIAKREGYIKSQTKSFFNLTTEEVNAIFSGGDA